MATYLIGDLQGCFSGLMKLLKHIDYQPSDSLYFAGDLLNRGPESLETIEWMMDQPNVYCILGNHDLHALALFHDCYPKPGNHTLHHLLSSPNKPKIIDYLRHQPLIRANEQFTLVHAGIYPQWTMTQALSYAKEVEHILRSDNYIHLLENMYGNTPTHWDASLTSWPRYRFILNACTRMRYLTPSGGLEFECTHAPPAPKLIPWFEYPNRAQTGLLCFGHWASLKGKIQSQLLQSLDGGYVWGGAMIAYCVETKKRWQVFA